MIHTEAWYRKRSGIEDDIHRLGQQFIRSFEEEGRVDLEVLERLKVLESRSGRPLPLTFEVPYAKVLESAGHLYVELLKKQLESQHTSTTFDIRVSHGEAPLNRRVRLIGVMESLFHGVSYVVVPVTESTIKGTCISNFILSSDVEFSSEGLTEAEELTAQVNATSAAIQDLNETVHGWPGETHVTNIHVYPVGENDHLSASVEWQAPLQIPLDLHWVTGIEFSS